MEVKKVLNEELKKLGILKSNTEQVIINCNAGAISDYKILERFK